MEKNISAAEAKKRLVEGNQNYVDSQSVECNVSKETLAHFDQNGQKPYAIVVTCSDSRVIPEAIFSAEIGDIFVIRVAGNVIDNHQLGSIEYAADHLGTNLVVVMGHDGCGAVNAALHHDPSGYIKYLTDEIKLAIGDEKDEFKACCLNVRHSCAIIEEGLKVNNDSEDGIKVVGAVYHLANGEVEFLQ